MEDNIIRLADSEICKRIGKRLRSLRLRQNFTQEVLSRKAVISVSTLKKIESGEIKSFDALMRVMRTLGELNVLSPLIKEYEMSPVERYEFQQFLKKKQRKRASSPKKSTPSKP